MHVGKYRSMGEAALQAGNSEAIIRRHYLDLKTPAEAEELFTIMPQRRRDPVAVAREKFAAAGEALTSEPPASPLITVAA